MALGRQRWVVVVLSLFLLTGCQAQLAPTPGDPPIYEGVVVAELAPAMLPPVAGLEEELVQVLQVRILTGDQKGQLVEARNGEQGFMGSGLRFRVGDRVQVTPVLRPGATEYVVIDYVRRPALYGLAALFALATVVVSGWRGVSALAGLVISFVALVWLILPQLLSGRNPVAVSVLGATAIMVTTLSLAHGLNRKSLVAMTGTSLSLTLTALLGWLFVHLARLSGLTSEEAFYLQSEGNGQLNLKGLLLAGMIVGGLGVLDDITVSQAAVVFALRAANPAFGWWELYRRAMAVGRDHIASTVNTLVLAYAGASLPLLLLFLNYQVPFGHLINQEFMAAEIIQVLVGSLGLITAVPITTALAAGISLRVDPAVVERDLHRHHHGHHHPH